MVNETGRSDGFVIEPAVLAAAAVVLVRHAAFEVAEDATGRRREVLTAAGRERAEALASALAAVERPLVLYSSPQARAVATARPLATASGQPVYVDEDLAELRLALSADVDVGNRSAEAWRQARRHPELPPLPGAESLAAVQRRALACLRGSVRANPGRLVVAVTHGGVMETVWLAIRGYGFDVLPRQRFEPEPGTFLTLESLTEATESGPKRL